MSEESDKERLIRLEERFAAAQEALTKLQLQMRTVETKLQLDEITLNEHNKSLSYSERFTWMIISALIGVGVWLLQHFVNRQ
jgi:hypothetical protein